MYIIERHVREPASTYPAAMNADEKMLTNGPASLSDAELLSLFITKKLEKSEKIALATRILGEFGSITKLVHSDYDQIKSLDFITKSAFVKLQAGVEIDRRRLFETCTKTDVLSSPACVREYLSSKLTGQAEEQFVGLLLDNRHRVIEFRVMAVGTIDSAAVYPREILKHCLSVNAAAIIFGHNHPSGVAEPSDTDVRLTRKLTDALALVDVRVLDHLIIGQGVQTSLAERGLM